MQLKSLGFDLKLKYCTICSWGLAKGLNCAILEAKAQAWAMKLCSAQSWEEATVHYTISRGKVVA